jgi:hypothetical protein
VWTGSGGRYRTSYIPTTAGTGTLRLFDAVSGTATPLPGSPFSPTILGASPLQYSSPSTRVPTYFKWSASQALVAMGLTAVQYNLFVSEDVNFASLTAARYLLAAPTTALPIILNPSTTYYFKVAVRIIDPLTGKTLDMDMSASEYATGLAPF